VLTDQHGPTRLTAAEEGSPQLKGTLIFLAQEITEAILARINDAPVRHWS
jgi:hypothetical protein